VGSRSGDVISRLEDVHVSRVFHCGTRKGDHGFETNGGRVLAVVSQGATREEARAKVYTDADKITFEGRQRRTDIAKLHFD
jgi:phosphoribosylamine--glycine ligase